MDLRKLKRVVVVLLCLFGAWLWQERTLALVGDVNLNQTVERADLDAIRLALGANSSDPLYQRPLDLNLDDKIDVKDLAIAGRSYGATRSFHFSRQISNQTIGSAMQACLDGLERINLIWVRGYDAYFSRLDRYGNTLIDDFPVDHSSSLGEVAMGCSAGGDTHLVWVHSGKLYQARFDRWGYPIVPPQKALDVSVVGDISLAMDSQGLAYVFFKRYYRPVEQQVVRLDAQGTVQLVSGQLAGGWQNSTTFYRKIAIDAQDRLHLMWYEEEGTDRLYYAGYSLQDGSALPPQVVGYTGYDGLWNGAKQPDLAVDEQGHAYVLWHPANSSELRLEKIAPDGTHLLDDFPLFTQWSSSGYTPPSVLAVGPDEQLHVLTLSAWGRNSSGHSAYGAFTLAGEPTLAMRWIYYGTPMDRPWLMVDSHNDLHVVFQSTSTSGYPLCGDATLCYLGTGFTPEAYDLHRSDWGLDIPHVSYEPLLARWGGNVTVSTTVFSAGWTTAPTTTLLLALETAQGVRLTEQTRTIPALSPRQTYAVNAVSLALPTMPPAGLEELEYLYLHLELDPQGTITETTEANNYLRLPLLVQQLPTRAGLFLIVSDETETVRGGVPERLAVGTATLQSSTSYRTVPITQEISVLDKALPVTAAPVTYTVSWQAPGYAPPAAAQVAIRRHPSDPYRIDYTPGNTVVLTTQRWGRLSGHLSANGQPLAGATIRLEGQGLLLTLTTDAQGNFSPAQAEGLGKLIPGTYELRISRAGYARLRETITIPALGAVFYERSMEPTSMAYVHGRVLNTYGNAVSQALVAACGVQTQSDDDGAFDLTVAASCKQLTVTRNGYAPLTESLSLSAGVETLLGDLALSFDPPLSSFSASDCVASRVIDQSSGDLLPKAPEDANWLKKQLYDRFRDRFWPEYRVYIAYGAYAYQAAAGYSGTSTEHYLQTVQVHFDPKTFEVHALLATVNLGGAPVPLPLVADSGERSALWAIEARLVNVKTGEVLRRVTAPLEGAAAERILDATTLTYDFGGVAVPDWSDSEVWLYYKVGKNEGGEFSSSPLLYQYDRQIMKFNLSAGSIRLDYGLGEFPLP